MPSSPHGPCTGGIRPARSWSSPGANQPCRSIPPLIVELHAKGCEVAIETNGTRPLSPGIDHVCVSPKAWTPLVLTSGDELKLVYPQPGAEPLKFIHLDFGRFYIQPMDGPDRAFHERSATRYCLEHPKWRLSVQLHKYLGLD
jgi:7-carboxy-7-deazaguanine synthase